MNSGAMQEKIGGREFGQYENGLTVRGRTRGTKKLGPGVKRPFRK